MLPRKGGINVGILSLESLRLVVMLMLMLMMEITMRMARLLRL
jgi:hypothetical protein